MEDRLTPRDEAILAWVPYRDEIAQLVIEHQFPDNTDRAPCCLCGRNGQAKDGTNTGAPWTRRGMVAHIKGRSSVPCTSMDYYRERFIAAHLLEREYDIQGLLRTIRGSK